MLLMKFCRSVSILSQVDPSQKIPTNKFTRERNTDALPFRRQNLTHSFWAQINFLKVSNTHNHT